MKIIFDKIKPFIKTIDLFSWGEPFLNKDIGSIIHYAKAEKPRVRIVIDSNFNIVSDKQMYEIVQNKLDVLKISCDGATQKTYEKYRRGGNLNNVLRNLEKLLAKKKELNANNPKIVLKYIVFKHNQQEVERAKNIAIEKGIDFEVSGMRIDCGKEIFEDVESSVERDKEWIPDISEYNNYQDLKVRKKFCEKPWKTMAINFNGDVVPCGAIYNCGKYKFGNLLKQDFNDVWNGENYVLAREIICGKNDDGRDLICYICKQNGYQLF